MSGKPITTLTNTTESEKTIVAQSVETAPAAVHESAAASGTSRGTGGVSSKGKKTGGRKKGSKPFMKTVILEQPTEVTGESPKGKGRMLMVVKAICAIRAKHAPAPVIAHVDIDGGRVVRIAHSCVRTADDLIHHASGPRVFLFYGSGLRHTCLVWISKETSCGNNNLLVLRQNPKNEETGFEIKCQGHIWKKI